MEKKIRKKIIIFVCLNRVIILDNTGIIYYDVIAESHDFSYTYLYPYRTVLKFCSFEDKKKSKNQYILAHLLNNTI